jgi:2-amino-4-hydroxy-6-hydroxymethyldihydropteridine diphosphokinase
MHTVLLLLGGNLGRVEENFAEAITKLEKHAEVIAVSQLYRTQAWKMQEAPDFLNQAVILRTSLSPHELLQHTGNIEQELGRERDAYPGAYQSRTLDIDILLVDEDIIDTSELKVPHPRMHLRKFTLVPAAEIAGGWRHPVLGKNLERLNKDCTDALNVAPV